MMRARSALVLAALIAATTFADSALAQGVPVNEATAEQKKSASEAYKRGRAAFEEHRHQEALAAFRESYDQVASPNAHMMIAMTLVNMGKRLEGYDELANVIEEADAAAAQNPKYEKTAADARNKRTEVEAELGTVTILGAVEASPPGGILVVNGRTIPPDAWSAPVRVDPGPVTVVLTGVDPISVNVDPGGSVTADFGAQDAVPADEGDGSYDGPDRMLMTYIAGGVGAAGLITFGVFGGLARGKFNDLDEACPDRSNCPLELEGTASDGKTFQTVANVGLVLGIVGVAAAAGFLTWELLDSDEDGDEGGDEGGDDMTARLSIGPGSISLSGAF